MQSGCTRGAQDYRLSQVGARSRAREHSAALGKAATLAGCHPSKQGCNLSRVGEPSDVREESCSPAQLSDLPAGHQRPPKSGHCPTLAKTHLKKF